jgi:hypothetical protein
LPIARRAARSRSVEMDADGSGSVSELEFLTVMASEVDDEAHEPASIEKLADDMFAILDADHSGIITFKEFRSELQKLPTGMTDEEIDELLQEMFGGGGDSKIDKVRAAAGRPSRAARGRRARSGAARAALALTRAPLRAPLARARRRSTSSCTSSNTTRRSSASDPRGRWAAAGRLATRDPSVSDSSPRAPRMLPVF